MQDWNIQTLLDAENDVDLQCISDNLKPMFPVVVEYISITNPTHYDGYIDRLLNSDKKDVELDPWQEISVMLNKLKPLTRTILVEVDDDGNPIEEQDND